MAIIVDILGEPQRPDRRPTTSSPLGIHGHDNRVGSDQPGTLDLTHRAGQRTEQRSSLRWFTRGAGQRTEQRPQLRWFTRRAAQTTAPWTAEAPAPLVQSWGGSTDGAAAPAPLVHPPGGSSDGDARQVGDDRSGRGRARAQGLLSCDGVRPCSAYGPPRDSAQRTSADGGAEPLGSGCASSCATPGRGSICPSERGVLSPRVYVKCSGRMAEAPIQLRQRLAALFDDDALIAALASPLLYQTTPAGSSPTNSSPPWRTAQSMGL